MFSKSKVAAVVAEFFGTFVLSLAVFSMVNTINVAIFNALVAGLALGLMSMVVGRASGAHLNPAVTLALWSMRKIETAQSIVYIAAQFLGGIIAWRIGEYLLGGPAQHIAQWGVDKRVLAAEVIGAFIFTFGVASAVYNAYEGRKLATVMGGSLSLGIIVASLASNGVLNPAVALGLNSVSWAYMIGPLLGAVLGMSVYSLIFAPTSAKVVVKPVAKAAVRLAKTTKKKTSRK